MDSQRNNWEIVKVYNEICQRNRIDILSSGRYFLNSFGYQRKLAEDIAAKLDVKPTDKVLDLGCNVGIYHRDLGARVAGILGVDGAASTVEKARVKNSLPNVSYQAFDILGPWPKLERPFNKVLVYSVIHFFDSLDDVRSLLQKIMSAHGSGPLRILFGEVRTKEQYDRFLEDQKTKTKPTWRDRKFKINQAFSRLVLGKVKSYPCKSFGIQELLDVGREFGFEATHMPQQRFHPFYNTCSDFVFEKR